MLRLFDPFGNLGSELGSIAEDNSKTFHEIEQANLVLATVCQQNSEAFESSNGGASSREKRLAYSGYAATLTSHMFVPFLLTII